MGLAQAGGNNTTEEDVRNALLLIPHYDQIEQYALDAQWIIGATALKLEATRREQRGEWTNALVTGFEYTLYGLFGSAIDMGLLSEYLYDERDPETQDLFDREIFAGTRLGFNDVAGTAVLAGAVRSLDETTVAYFCLLYTSPSPRD